MQVTARARAGDFVVLHAAVPRGTGQVGRNRKRPVDTKDFVDRDGQTARIGREGRVRGPVLQYMRCNGRRKAVRRYRYGCGVQEVGLAERVDLDEGGVELRLRELRKVDGTVAKVEGIQRPGLREVVETVIQASGRRVVAVDNACTVDSRHYRHLPIARYRIE